MYIISFSLWEEKIICTKCEVFEQVGYGTQILWLISLGGKGHWRHIRSIIININMCVWEVV